MSQNTAIVPLQQQMVQFYEDEIPAVLVDVAGEQRVYIPIRPICERLGLAWSSQLQRIKRDTILNEAMSGVFVTNTPLTKFSNPQEMICLPLDMLNGWLFGVNANRVRADLRDTLLRYQRECYRVLAAAFITTELETTSTDEQRSLIQIREMALAIAQLADQQITLTSRLDKAAIVVGEHGRRLTILEQQLAPRQAITDEQTSDIAEKVKALAMFLGEQDSTKNHFQSIFAELYRRFRVSSYKNIRQAQYHLVNDFLDDWHNSLSPQNKE